MPAKKKAPVKRAAPKPEPKYRIERVSPSVWVVDGRRYFTLADAEKAASG